MPVYIETEIIAGEREIQAWKGNAETEGDWMRATHQQQQFRSAAISVGARSGTRSVASAIGDPEHMAVYSIRTENCPGDAHRLS